MTSQNFTEALNKLWNKAPTRVRQAVSGVAMDVFEEEGVKTPQEIAHIMAQVSHECGGGTIGRENMNYSAKRIMEIFGVGIHSAKVTVGEAATLANNPKALAERVYGLGNRSKAKELGNTQVGDGYKYRGNGFGQLTGRASHRAMGLRHGIDLEDHPELLEDPAMSFRVAVSEYVKLGVLPYARKDNITMVTRRVNGGTNGLADRTVWLRKWKAELPDIDEAAWTPRGAATEGHTSLFQSKILQGAAGTAASTGIAAISKGAENANVTTTQTSIADVTAKVQDISQQAADAVTTITIAKDNAGAIIEVARPFLGVPSNYWGYIAMGAVCVSMVAIAYTIWQRVKKWQDQGV